MNQELTRAKEDWQSLSPHEPTLHRALHLPLDGRVRGVRRRHRRGRELLATSLGLLVVLGHVSLAQATPASAAGELRHAVTLHSVGFEWDLTGDDNHNATATLAYRVEGAGEYRDGMPLLRIDDSTHNMLAGSLLFLEPGTTYDVRLTYADPDGGGEVQELQVTTRRVPELPTGGRTFHVVPGDGGGDGSEAAPFRGFDAAQLEARPGDIFLLHGGTYERDETLSLFRGGEPGNYVVWKAAGDGEVEIAFSERAQRLQVTASHVWVEGVRIQNQGTAVGTDDGASDVVITRCEFLNVHYGVWLRRDSREWYIADNVIVGDNAPNVESFNGEGVDLGRSDGHVVAYNRISRTADGVSYPRRNCDIYGNDIFDTSDDGIEADDGQSNLRIWGNRIHNARANGIAFQDQDGAPWYIVRNQVINNMQSVFKLRSPRRYVVMHNTFITYHDFFNSPCWSDERTLMAVMSNNLWYSVTGTDSCSEPLLWEGGTESGALGWWTDLDYDAFGRGDRTQAEVSEALMDLAETTGRYENAVAIDGTCFRDLDVPGAPPMSVPAQMVELNEGCAAVDAGEVIPGMNDGYVGAGPDMGAYEFGGTPPHYGPRPILRCGDGVCAEGEDCESCEADCGACPAVCGDAVCDEDEDCMNCPDDCERCSESCGDGLCGDDEDCMTCPDDCGGCAPADAGVQSVPQSGCGCRIWAPKSMSGEKAGLLILILLGLIRRRRGIR